MTHRVLNYDAYGQRMTDCCGDFATYGPNVDFTNLDETPLRCAKCGRLTTKGEGDQTEFQEGVTLEIWNKRFADRVFAELRKRLDEEG